eukprot:TRINITY_DN29776_c0_g1_i1.p1 TRINITY_DN29776_c0_g1~~TRINITY_DN29776_c0_g1_i1.p1  ORF type:complete len:458 (+),score=72.10 TRINITY_DN29776_c0_g1_i1:287-1660(+)
MSHLWRADALCDGVRAEERVQWLLSNREGMTLEAAKRQVVMEFPGVFQQETPGWDPAAMCGEHTAEARMEWLIKNEAITAQAAQQKVMQEFPSMFQSKTSAWDDAAQCGDYTAAQRAKWLVSNKGMAIEAAQQQVMGEFPEVFGTPVPGWNPNADCDGHRASRRMQWLVDNKGMTEAAAQRSVMGEFPHVFGGGGVAALGCASAEALGLTAMPAACPTLLVWSDEFDYNGAPDPAKWSYDLGGHGWGNNEKQHYTDRLENAWVGDGALHICAAREDYKGNRFTSARLVTKGKMDFKYGRVEVRLAMPVARGTWPAAWMLPTEDSYGQWPKSGEIDIMEHVGCDVGNVHGTVHTEAFNHMKSTQVGRVIKANPTEFHTYAVEWTPDGISFIMDDKKYHHFPKHSGEWEKWPFDHRFHILLNVAVGGDWGGMKGIDEQAIGSQKQVMKVQWVRVYRLPG